MSEEITFAFWIVLICLTVYLGLKKKIFFLASGAILIIASLTYFIDFGQNAMILGIFVGILLMIWGISDAR